MEVQPDRPAPSDIPCEMNSDDSDIYTFEAFYNANLPRLSLPEAHRLVEQIRNRLVAGQVSQTMNWHDPRQASALLAADIHCSATQEARTGTADSRRA